METKVETQHDRHRTAVVLAAVIVCLLIAGTMGYAMSSLAASSEIRNLQDQVSSLGKQASDLSDSQSTTQSQDVTYLSNSYVSGDNFSLAQLYQQVNSSIVVVQGTTVQTYYNFWGQPYYQYGQVQGSGFVYNSSGQLVIVTNYHVIDGATNVTITFTNGNTYAARVVGSDPYADLAVLTSSAPRSEYSPLRITNSSALRVGDSVIAIGTPYGLAGTVTTGIISALGRTITESTAGGYVIADCIQTTTPINPGNSGGPLLDYEGEVVGITTAIVTSSQGLGFAIPSNSILREIQSLISTGSYDNHPMLAASGIDVTYEIAQSMKVNVTYGWLITQVTTGGAAQKAGLRGGTTQAQIDGTQITTGGDIITAINGTRIRNIDDLSTYLEENTLPGRTIEVTIVRNNHILTVPVELQARPALT